MEKSLEMKSFLMMLCSLAVDETFTLQLFYFTHLFSLEISEIPVQRLVGVRVAQTADESKSRIYQLHANDSWKNCQKNHHKTEWSQKAAW